MLVVGAGVVGLAVAWQLLQRGHPVRLLDPRLKQDQPNRSGSAAALGVLMARVFHRSSGRAWRLRQRSHALWAEWLATLSQRGHGVPRRRGLLLLASSGAELERQQRLVAERRRQGLALEHWGPPQLAGLQPALPAGALGGLFSPDDGQLDPASLLAALWDDCRRLGLEALAERAEQLERRGSDWVVVDRSGARHPSPWLVLSAGVDSAALLQGLGHQRPTQPVLGQALELELARDPAWSWPGVTVWNGINLVPRPDLPGGRRFWLGATLEPGALADRAALESLRRWGDPAAAPAWLAEAEVVRHWQGLRCRPLDRPAPLLEQLEPGLLLLSGHYRNGVLLAPASAEWACLQIGSGR